MIAFTTSSAMRLMGPLTNPGRPTHRRLWSRGCGGFASSRSCRASPTAFDAGIRCRLLPRSAGRGAGPRRSSLLSRRKREAGRGFCAGGEDCQQFQWSISSHLGRIRESKYHIASSARRAPISPMPDAKIIPLGPVSQWDDSSQRALRRMKTWERQANALPRIHPWRPRYNPTRQATNGKGGADEPG